MAQINVIGQNGGRQISLDLPEPNANVLHEVVTWQLANRRRGTASTKTRAQVSATGKKMYSQKGTGNARHGDRSVPTFVGGGVAFGPKPRNYGYTLPRKVRQLGLAMALADRQQEGKLLGRGRLRPGRQDQGLRVLGRRQRHERHRERSARDRRRAGPSGARAMCPGRPCCPSLASTPTTSCVMTA